MSLVSNEIVRQLEFKTIDFRFILAEFSLSSRTAFAMLSLKCENYARRVPKVIELISESSLTRRAPP